jgi:hypothetical protein
MYVNSENFSLKAEERITVKEATKGPESKFWKEALQSEYEGQDRLDSFIICFRQAGIPL